MSIKQTDLVWKQSQRGNVCLDVLVLFIYVYWLLGLEMQLQVARKRERSQRGYMDLV